MGSLLAIGAGSAGSVWYVNNVMDLSLYSIDDLPNEEVKSVQVKTSFSFFPLLSHTYVVIETLQGRFVRFDYSSFESVQATFDYFEMLPSSLECQGIAVPGISVRRALKVFEKHSQKNDYSLISHNCDSVSHDFYNEITGNDIANLAFRLEELFKNVFSVNLKGKEEFDFILSKILRKRFQIVAYEALKQGKTKDQILQTLKNFDSRKEKGNFEDIFSLMIEGYSSPNDWLQKLIRTIAEKDDPLFAYKKSHPKIFDAFERYFYKKRHYY